MTILYWTIALAGVALVAVYLPLAYRDHKEYQERVKMARDMEALAVALHEFARALDLMKPGLEQFAENMRAMSQHVREGVR